MKAIITATFLAISSHAVSGVAPYTQTEKVSSENIEGRCITAQAGNTDIINYCINSVVKTIYDNNRTVFTFILNDLGFISFSGTQSNENTSNDNYYLQVDLLFSGLRTVGYSTENVKGTCKIYTKNGLKTLNCKTEGHTSMFEFIIENIVKQDIGTPIEHDYPTEKTSVNGTNLFNINNDIQKRFKYIGYVISPDQGQTEAIIYYPASKRYKHYKIGDTLINNRANKYRLDITNINPKLLDLDLTLRANEPEEDVAKLNLRYAGHSKISNNNDTETDYTDYMYRVRSEKINITTYIDVFLSKKTVLLDKTINSSSKVHMPFGKFKSISGMYNWTIQQLVNAGYNILSREGTIIIKKGDYNSGTYIKDTLPESHNKICDKVEMVSGITIAKKRASLDIYIRTFSALMKNMDIIRYPESANNSSVTLHGEIKTDICKLFINIFNEYNLYPEIVDNGIILHEGK